MLHESFFTLEMNFYVEGDKDYTDCWLGKMPNKSDLTGETYWYGLADNGSQAYEIFEKIHWYSLDGCSLEERLNYYVND